MGLTLYMVLLNMPKTQGPDHSVPRPRLRTVLQSSALRNEVMSRSRTKRMLAAHLPKAMDCASSVFPSYNTCAGMSGPTQGTPTGCVCVEGGKENQHKHLLVLPAGWAMRNKVLFSDPGVSRVLPHPGPVAG